MTPLDELKLKNAGLTVSRMVQSYKQAMDPTEHINILSDQTLIEPEHIVEILRDAGCVVGKYRKRWTQCKQESEKALGIIQDATKESQEREEKSPDGKQEERKVEEKAKRQYHRKSKEEIAKAAESVPNEKIVATFSRDKAEKVIYGEKDPNMVPAWLYDLAETEYQLIKSKVEPYIKDFERMKEVELWLDSHKAI